MTVRQSAVAALTGLALTACASSVFAQNDAQSGSSQPQGIYSAERLMETDVYTPGNNGKAVGEIENILFDNNMSIQSFVIQTKGRFGLGGKSYVVKPDEVSVQTQAGDQASKPSYRVTLRDSAEDLASHPVYSDSWWNQTQAQAADAWQQTKQSAGSAWTTIKNKTSAMVNGTENAADQATDSAGDAADNAAGQADDAADNAGDAAGDAASNAKAAADTAQDKAQNAGDAAGDAASNATDAAGNAANNAQDTAGDAANQATNAAGNATNKAQNAAQTDSN